MSFVSTGNYWPIKGRGYVVAVKNPGGYPNPRELTGQEVMLDGKRVKVIGVECFAIALPYPETMAFALLLEHDYDPCGLDIGDLTEYQTACVDEHLLGHCGDENCGGLCEFQGFCGCMCHD